ncbi:MBOAT, membrane-bound O-acyltransferase family-domain-containing protein [Lasiosphaeris hirsuta]|uniref:MBOAT, membrane-bound O-acyltransferase family-domain-containing protein n=1 Tax=Lasiosphaeris hirsuta TaxID=260670 RepID=A0AA40DMA3_9PEZI|nr:MBOAT, membrane-bound O-acyltransferase family-domain-containing protein [Lasiosphaeris hirsuta]
MDPRRGARAAADHDLTPRRTSPPSFQEISFVVTDSNPGLDPSETTSEEDYDGPSTPPDAIPTIVHHRPSTPPTAKPGGTSHLDLRKGGLPLLKTGPVAAARHRPGGFVVTTTAADALAVHEAGGRRRRGKFSDLVFTRTFSAFDRQNPEANSIFHGFFTLFWMAVFLFVVRVGAQNYQRHGNPLGTNEVMRTMFRKDVLVLLVADGVMCAVTGVGWVLQRMVRRGLVDWDRTGWVLQNIWQSVFIAAVIGLTMLRDWPWTHTVFFVMHGLTMLMKMHSFAFYNGYLSSAYKKRSQLLAKLKELEHISPIHSPSTTEPPVSAISTSHLAAPPSAHEYKELRRSMPYMKVPDIDKIATAISSGELLDGDQVDVFERMLKWEVDALTDELKGKSTAAAHAYPNNLTLANHYEFIVLPTLVYELEYPRSESISLSYAAEKAAACFGVIFVMILISQTYIYPVVMETVRMKDEGVPIATRFQYFPWMLSDLIFPFMLEYLLAWYLIWETILNFTAEMTYFADRNFYDAWWNSVSWDQFARDWNRPVHNFLLRHVYHSSISAMRVDKHTATLLTFLLSACVHELVMWCIFKKLRGYLLFLQMCQLPLVGLSRTKWLRNRSTVGNMFFWFGIFTGPSLLCSLYLIL